jgi:hypothetical protein
MLYPIGVASELTMAWLALPELRDTKLWSIEMPNAWNFAFSYYWACVLAMITYLPGGRGRRAVSGRVARPGPRLQGLGVWRGGLVGKPSRFVLPRKACAS